MFALVLFVYKIVCGPRTFSNACFRFLQKTFPDLQDNEIHFVNICLHPPSCKLCRISIFHTGSFFVKKESIYTFFFFFFLLQIFYFFFFFFVRLIANFEFARFHKNYTAYNHFHENGPYGKIPTKKEPIRMLIFSSRPSCHAIKP